MQIRISDAFDQEETTTRAGLLFEQLSRGIDLQDDVAGFERVGSMLAQLQSDGLLKDGTCYMRDGYLGFWESSKPLLVAMCMLELALRQGSMHTSGIDVDQLPRQLPSDERWVPLARKSSRNRSDLCCWRAYLSQMVDALHLRCQEQQAELQQPPADEEEEEYYASLSFAMKSGKGNGATTLATKDEIAARFEKLLKSHPYLDQANHLLNTFVLKYITYMDGGNLRRAENCINILETRISVERQRLQAAFSKFDIDNNKCLDVQEFKNFAVYVGFGKDVVEKLCLDNDTDSDGNISFEEFLAFIENGGGFEKMFRARRKHLGGSCSVEVGARVLAYFFDGEGHKSSVAWDARVLEIDDRQENALVLFNTSIDATDRPEEPKQQIPLSFINQDVDVMEALSEIGVMDDDKMYWAMMLPPSEIQVLKGLEGCQRHAIRHVRDLATKNHIENLPKLVEKAKESNIEWGDIGQALIWLRDLAPVISHVNLDRKIESKGTILGRCLMEDELFKNLFDVGTGGGCTSFGPRAGWETAIFGGSYDDTSFDDKPSKRPKYGVLDVCNDPRGVPAAWQYGDSYFILKNVRLRSTFASCDTCCVPDCAVLDQQAGVLNEYEIDELQEVVRVATAPEGSRNRIGNGQIISDYKEAQFHGLVRLDRDVQALVVNERHRTVFDPFNPNGSLTWCGQGEAGADSTENHFGEKEVEKLCAKHGWKLYWMSEEATRRINEVREVSQST